jgi:uncharacterized protein (TIGR02246 family)
MNDDQAIRDLIATWHHAAAAGDLPAILTLMSEDVVFLTSGQPPMQGRDTFAEGFRAVLQNARIRSTFEIQELQVSGDLAYSWTHLTVTVIPRAGGEPVRRAGHTLSILRKDPSGRWLMTRDANMLAPESSGADR